jgi:integrase
MLLSEAINFTFINRHSWAEGKGASTCRINSNHCLRILGDIAVEEIQSKHFALISTQLRKEGKKPGTINRVTAALSTIINELRQHGYKLDEPVYKRQREPKGRLEFYTEQDMDKLLMASLQLADDHLMFDTILFAQKTGCRQGEMLKLTAADINLELNEIIFRDTKAGRDHVIPVHSDLMDTLERRLSHRVGDKVFEWRDKDQLLRAFRKLQESAGVSTNMCWHHIRHTTATTLVSKNVPIRVIMAVLNHSNINTTLRYAHAADKSVAAAIDML